MPESAKEEIGRLAAEYNSLIAGDSPRLSRMANFALEYDAPRSSDINGSVADYTDYGRQKSVQPPSKHNIPVPLATTMTIKHAHRLFGQLPEAVVDRRQETPQERYRSDTIEKLVWAIVRASGGKTQLKDAAWDGSKFGASVFDLYFDQGKQLPTYCTIDPREVLVVPGVRNVHEYKRVYRAWQVSKASLLADYEGKTYRDVPVSDLLQSISSGTCTLVQMTDQQKVVRFVLDGASEGNKIPIYEKEHNYGFCPYVVVPNIGPEREIWGWADYELYRGLVHYIPALLSREADVIRATAGGAYTEDGTGQSAERILDIVRKGGVLPVKRGSTVTAIESAKMPDFEPEHKASAMELLKMVGFAPDAAWGDGSAGSGSDRGLQLAPLLELTAMKQANWAMGLQRLFDMALRMLEKRSTLGSYYSGEKPEGTGSKSFVVGPIGPNEKPLLANAQTLQPAPGQLPDAYGDPDMETVELPRNPKELFQGDYTVRFDWKNRIDPDDPAFVASELNKFQQGAQSLRTTMEHMGITNPEDEMKLIEQEAERFPWINQGMVKMLTQGAGGAPAESNIGGASETMGGDTAALDADAMSGALPGGTGTPYGAA